MCLFIGCVAWPTLVLSQGAKENPLAVSDDGAAYLRAIRLKRIDPDVAYFDPTAPPPPVEVRQAPRVQDETEDEEAYVQVGSVRVPVLLVTASVLLLIVYIVVRVGGGVSVSLGREAGNPKRGGRGSDGAAQAASDLQPGHLDAILSMHDRRAALIHLAHAALVAVVMQNGLLLQRSWTARDVLRHLPASQRHLQALRELVHASERVHFGGRDISEDEFQRYVNGIRPILSGGVS